MFLGVFVGASLLGVPTSVVFSPDGRCLVVDLERQVRKILPIESVTKSQRFNQEPCQYIPKLDIMVAQLYTHNSISFEGMVEVLQQVFFG